MNTNRISQTMAVAALATVLMGSWAAADPLPRRDVLKFSQVPMIKTLINGTDYYGHDELSTAYGTLEPSGEVPAYNGTFMADDFADTFDTPVVHVRWWGSYINNEIIQPVDQFLISFEADIPAGVDDVPYSRPGEPLLNQIVRRGQLSPGSGTFTERRVSPDQAPEDVFEYNAELHLDKTFRQQPDTVYWLKIVALVDVSEDVGPDDPRTKWGWHNRDYTVMDPLASPAVRPGEQVVGTLPDEQEIWHFQDNAVDGSVSVEILQNDPLMPEVFQDVRGPNNYLDGIDGPDGIIGEFSKDLAFELYTIPEPTTMTLLGLGAACLIRRRRR